MMRQKIRVLHIITRLDAGGSATNTIETVARLNPSLYECTLVIGLTYDPDGRINQELKDKKINTIFIEDLRRNINPWHDFKAFCKLYDILKRNQYDIVHTHTSKAGILGRWAAKLAKVRTIVHTPHGHVFYGYFDKLTSQIFINVERWTARLTDKIITLTELGKKEHVQFKIAAEDKFVVIASGIDINYFSLPHKDTPSLKQKLKIPEDAFIFGTVARLEPIKGNRHLIEAFAKILPRHSHARLLLTGDGPQRKELESLCQELNLNNHVCFAGFQSDVGPYLQIMDNFVLASLNEGMGRSILEAMACGKPIIATRVGGIPELIEHNQTGLLVESNDVEALSAAMESILKSKEDAQRLGENAKKKAGHRYSLESMVQTIENLYEELLKK
jgi:glycosyltransferase involved in cell wall biosynthesis